MTTFINLTPHDINAIDLDGNVVTFPKSGNVARCEEQRDVVSTLDNFNLYSVSYGNVYGLPDPKSGVCYIVSMAVRLALPDRVDLLSPGELVRDEGGKPVGCKGFAVN